MRLRDAIMKLNPHIQGMRDLVAYDADGSVIEYDLNAAQALVAAEQYKEDRAAAYPSFADQFDLLYHGGYDAWKAAIDAIKQEYPKP